MVQHSAQGAYGLQVHGIEAPGLIDAPAHWPALQLSVTVGAPLAQTGYMQAESVHLRYVGGHQLSAEREPARAQYRSPHPLQASALAHPVFSRVASVFARWQGHEVLHAGAFLNSGGAWALLASNEGGKSTLLAGLASRGLDILSDDLLVVDGRRVYAGPRCLDLRETAAEHLQVTGTTRRARDGERHRLTLDATPTDVPLAGLIFLEWGERVQTARVPAKARGAYLAPFRRWPALAAGPHGMLELLATQSWTLRRPRDWQALPETLHHLGVVSEGGVTAGDHT